jgi:FlaG/FlaF family flagellin (archaellin)
MAEKENTKNPAPASEPAPPASKPAPMPSTAALLAAVVVGGVLVGTTMWFIPSGENQLAATVVPGQQKKIDTNKIDQDDNDIPDEDVTVNGKYTSLYAYDDLGDWYWDLGDGRVQGTVASVDDLDAGTLTTCDYQVQYRGNFENDPFMDSGWIMNNINCSGYDDNGTYNYLIVHETDPRYRGNPDWSVWGTWEYHVLTESGKGNLTRPQNAIGS